MIVWAAFGLAFVSFLLWVAFAVVVSMLWAKARPLVQVYGPMVSAMMPAAAGTGDVGNGTPSSPAATPDRCEYEDHVWRETPGRWDGHDTEPAHYCTRCGYAETIPG